MAESGQPPPPIGESKVSESVSDLEIENLSLDHHEEIEGDLDNRRAVDNGFPLSDGDRSVDRNQEDEQGTREVPMIARQGLHISTLTVRRDGLYQTRLRVVLGPCAVQFYVDFLEDQYYGSVGGSGEIGPIRIKKIMETINLRLGPLRGTRTRTQIRRSKSCFD